MPVHPDPAVEIRPWGMKKFYSDGPSGVPLRFGCAPEEIIA